MGDPVRTMERTEPMAKHVMETVTFKLNDGVDRGDFAAAARRMSDWITAQPGFVARRLSVAEDGTWVEQVEWADMASAKAAASAIGTEPANADFLRAIDGPSARMRHSDLEVSVN